MSVRDDAAPSGGVDEEASIDALRGDVPVAVRPESLVASAQPDGLERYRQDFRAAEIETKKLALDVQQQEVNRLEQEYDHRRAFFRWALWAISIVLGLSAIMFGWYMIVKGPAIDSAVMVAWLSTTLVETLGLGYIIAHSLFEANVPVKRKNVRRGNR